jgi:hypothetical protein
MEREFASMRKEALLKGGVKEEDLPKFSSSRDNYGWRSLPSGSRYLGATNGNKKRA